jgi:hypothetical protein
MQGHAMLGDQFIVWSEGVRGNTKRNRAARGSGRRIVGATCSKQYQAEETIAGGIGEQVDSEPGSRTGQMGIPEPSEKMIKSKIKHENPRAWKTNWGSARSE